MLHFHLHNKKKTIHLHLDDEFVETEHPRGRGGKFARKGTAAVKSGAQSALNIGSSFSKQDYQILKEYIKPGSTARKSISNHILGFAKSVPQLIKTHLQHEKHKAINAAYALKCIVKAGCKPGKSEFKALGEFGFTVLMSAAGALTHGDPTGTMGHLASALGQEIIQHTILEHTAKFGAGVGRLAFARVTGKHDAVLSSEDYELLSDYLKTLAKAVAYADVKNPSKDSKHVHFNLDDFEESEHPRVSTGPGAGEFAKKGTGGTSTKSKSTSGNLISEPDKSKWPSHIQKLKIPPAWTDVKISSDPNASLQAIGRDVKGRAQYVYSEKFRQSQTAAKFKRIKQLDQKFDQMVERNQRALTGKDKIKQEHALVTSLIMDMGLRPGSEKETGAAEKAYGATTLRSEHVVSNGDETRLQFTGKKGVKIDLPVTDPNLAGVLRERAKTSGQLFPNVSDSTLRKHVASLGGGFKTKDLRTLKGTRLANDIVQSQSVPTSKSAYKKAVRSVAEAVSKKLGNTPAVALQAYISPVVFAPWQSALEG